ncbi:casein alpha s1 [Ictidomys tridecemlineatus]|nr:casein alpha s1 [Ictidomys tridecemlineatus]
MKLLILTCLVAAALARPKFPLRQPELFQNQVDSRETTPELREEHIMADAEQKEVSSSASEENVVHAQKQPMRVANEELAQFYVEPLQQFYQLNTYPFAAWYYPVQMQDIPLLPFFPIFGPIASENVEKTVMPVWWSVDKSKQLKTK